MAEIMEGGLRSSFRQMDQYRKFNQSCGLLGTQKRRQLADPKNQRKAAALNCTQDSDLYDLPWNDSATCQDFDPEAVAQAEQEAQEQWELEREQLMQQAEEAKLEAQADRVEEVVAMRKGFDDLEAVLKKDEAIMKRAHSYSRLSAAVLNLEEALLRGNATKELEAVQQAAAEAGDSFVSGLLKSLPVDLLAQPVPTESGLRHVLSEHLSRWATAALVPPDSGLLGELLGRAFRQFYILDGEDVCMPQESETARNLRVLGKAAKHTNVREALPLLDELQGLAAKRVEATTQEARQVLHVRKTFNTLDNICQEERLANYAARGEDPSKDQEWLEVFGPPVSKQPKHAKGGKKPGKPKPKKRKNSQQSNSMVSRGETSSQASESELGDESDDNRSTTSKQSDASESSRVSKASKQSSQVSSKPKGRSGIEIRRQQAEEKERKQQDKERQQRFKEMHTIMESSDEEDFSESGTEEESDDDDMMTAVEKILAGGTGRVR
ncbi:unnamed protein product [Cladocopium goreaui]|uniref:Copia protein n=1 Tax=Cladocopium goreaui TaxID=2562237 RepID=A0A9P1DA13_9DINO|nr:unnamed protein product [Cladocopium goreaui]